MNRPSFVVPSSEAQARAIQEDLRSKLTLHDDFATLELIAGVDVGYDVPRNLAHASIVTMTAHELKPLEQVQAFAPADFPYIPGLLSFREIPAILAALATLSRTPDVLMVDGQGIAHPRRMGIAAHLGVILDMPSIGVAKSRLTGRFETPGLKKGDNNPLMVGKEQIGIVLRSRDNVNPLFISPGHRVGMQTALTLTLQCLTRYRLPEPTRLADKFSKCKPPPLQLL
jgi:deoxyribonuclease V